MIQTSYFTNYRNFPEGKRKVSISRFTPKWFEEDHNALELAPSASLLKDYKEGLEDEAGYEKRYKKETLSKLDPKEIAKKYKDAIFLCYESDDDFCHRKLVANWLNKNGILVEEVKNTVSIFVSIEDNPDEEFFKKIMDRLLSNYKNIRNIVCQEEIVIDYSKNKNIKTAIIDEYDIAVVFKNKKVDKKIFDKDIERIYWINTEKKEVNIIR